MNAKYMPSRRSSRWAILLASALGLLMPGVSSQAADEETPYEIIDGKVDFGTYNGFRRYHSHCHVCHGPDGLGSSYGPALTESLKDLTYDDYMEIVVNGRQNVDQTQQSVMPAFGLVEDVMMSVDDIYNYLKARSDGALPRGRPARLPKDSG